MEKPELVMKFLTVLGAPLKYGILLSLNQGPLNWGGVTPLQTVGVSRSGPVLPFLSLLSFLGFPRFCRDFPDSSGDGPRIFPICPFPISRPVNSTYEEQS